MDDIVRVQIYVTDIRLREEKARREFFTGDFVLHPNEVSQLAAPGLKVEIDSIAIEVRAANLSRSRLHNHAGTGDGHP